MPYLNCPRCALTIRVRGVHVVMENCPRCLARTGTAIPLYVSAAPHRLKAQDTPAQGDPPQAPHPA